MGISMNMPYHPIIYIYIYIHIRTVNMIEFKQHLEDHQERDSELLRTTIVSHVCQDLLSRLTISIREVGLVNYPGARREWFGAIGVSIFPSPTKWGANWTYYEFPNDMVTLVRFCSSSVRCAFLELAESFYLHVCIYIYIYMYIIEGSLEVKLPTIWKDGKAEVERVREEKSRREKIREEKEWEERRCRCAKREQSRETLFFQWFVAKAAGAEPSGQMRDEKLHAVVARSTFASEKAKDTLHHLTFGALLEVEMSKRCTLLWREAHLEVNMYKTHHVRTTFRSWCQKSSRRCGAKHICKSKCTKHFSVGTLLEVEMSKAYFQVKSARKNWRVRSTFRCYFVWQAQGIVHLVKSEQNVEFCSSFSYNHHYTTLHFTTL